MIAFAEEKDREQIKKLWREVFGDGEEEIEGFMSRYLKNMLLYKKDRKVAGMLSMLPVSMKNEKGRYIYAVATAPEARGAGISTGLLKKAEDHIKKSGEKFSVLTPAESSLFDFYKNRGYTAVNALKRVEFDSTGFGNAAYEVDKITPQKLFALRREYFKDKSFVEWGPEELEYIWRLYKGGFYRIRGSEGQAFAVCSSVGGLLDIKELCCDGLDAADCVASLNGIFNKPHCRAAMPDDKSESPSAMIRPSGYKDIYFNLAMD